MDRVSATNFQTIGGRRTWLDKDPAHGVPFGTTFAAIWAAGVQESIVEVIEAAGLTPTDSALGSLDTQLLQAIKILAAKAALPGGQCRLSVTSSTSLLLSPFNGNLIWVNGAAVAVPSAGVSIANTGLVAATLYYVYAWVNSGALALELSATGHSTSTVDGTQIKTGDATRSLVGMIYTGAGTPGIFVDGITQRFCANWFFRRGRSLVGSNTAGAATSSTSATELATASRVQFLSWSDEDASLSIIGSASNSTAGDGAATNVWLDGASATAGTIPFFSTSASLSGGVFATFVGGITEGIHTLSPAGASLTGGVSSYFATANAIVRI